MSTNLNHASIEQLLQWQAQIVDELARRCSVAAPIVARAPWEEPIAPAPIQPGRGGGFLRLRNEGISASGGSGGSPNAQQLLLLEQLAGMFQPQPTAPQAPAPSMLGGQQRHVGTAVTTKTDPAYAARFAQTPVRVDGAPPVNGSGRGEGMAEMAPG